MNTFTVESANKERNRYLLLLAIFWPFIYLPAFSLREVVPQYVFTVTIVVCLVALCITTFVILRLIRLNKKLRYHPEVARALKEELFSVYKLKALNLAFFILLFALAFIGPVCSLYDIPSFILCRILFFIGIEAYLITWLLYNRN